MTAVTPAMAHRGIGDAFRQLADGLRDGVATVDDHGIVRYANARLHAIAGAPPGTLVGRQVQTLATVASADELQRLLDSSKTCTGDVQLRAGDDLCVAATVTTTRIEAGGEILTCLVVVDRTEHEDVASALAFQSRLLDAAGEAIIATDIEGTISYANPAAERLYGWPPGTLNGLSISDATVPAESLGAADEVMEVVQAGRTWSGEFLVRRRDGTRFLAQVTDTPVHDDEGNLTGIIGVSSDLTDRKLADDRLRTSERWFRTLVQNSSDCIFVMDADSNLQYVNPAAQQLVGGSIGCGDNVRALDTIYREDRQSALEMLEAVARTPGTHPPVMIRTRDVDKGWRTFECVATNCLTDPAIGGIVVNARDVTEEYETRASLATSEHLLREAQRISDIGHWRWDMTNGGLELLADRLYDMHGLTREEWGGTVDAYFKLIPADDQPAVYRAIESGLAGGRASVVHRIVRPDGSVRWMRQHAETVYTHDGEARQVLGTCQDITEQEQLRHALDERVKELTCLVEVSTATQQTEDAASLCAIAAAGLVNAMQHSALAGAVVTLDETSRSSGSVDLGQPHISVPVEARGQPRGAVRVGYRSVHPEILTEEIQLVHAVGASLGLWLERRDAAVALRESEARFRRLFDNAADIVYRYRVGPDAGFDYVSPAVLALTGYTQDEVVADPRIIDASVHPDDRAKVADLFTSDGANGAHLLRLVSRDGAVRWTEHRIVPVRDGAGELVAVEGVARDVTERITAANESGQRAREDRALACLGEAALTRRTLDEFLSAAVDAFVDTFAADAVAVYELQPDDARLSLAAHRGFAARCGTRRREDAHTADPVAAALADAATAAVAELVDVTATRPAPLPNADATRAVATTIAGKGRPFGAVAVHLSDGDRASVQSASAFLQIAAHIIGETLARFRAEEATSRRERDFRSLAEHSPDIIARFDRRLRHVYVNPTIERISGIPADHFIGRTLTELQISSALTALWDSALERVFATGKAGTLQFSWPSNKTARYFESRQIPELAADGTVETVLAVTRDISAIRQADDQRRNTLTRIVAAQEEERARIAEDIHDDSIQVMTAVGLRLGALRRQVDEGDVDMLAAVEVLEDAVRRSVERLRSLMFALRPPELDRDGLSAALRHYLETTLPSATQPRWELVDRTDTELPPEVRAVMYRVAQEAITNAIKHANASVLRVSVEQVGPQVCLEVRDDGDGFDVQQLHVVRPHHLGTTAMRERVESTGGHLRISSSPGAGTIVRACIPQAIAETHL